MPDADSKVYLTFDDGPIPDVTPWVLDLLKENDAKASFFCIGDNVKRHPSIFQRIVEEGHTIGNHTYNHLNGWTTNADDYIKNCLLFDDLINESFNDRSINPFSSYRRFFRPPYGKLTQKQSRSLIDKGYTIYMWDLLSGDFSQKISPEKCLQNVIENILPGNIVVFHDSLKAENNLRYVLPKVLGFITESKWKCEALA
jgi:peptidoglycan/xylan/chitin deacetylase (PgdA/CDA1 family)